MPRRYWLLKSEPGTFSIEDLARAPARTTGWDGVRNYQARNHLKECRTGDGILFYHSGEEPGVAGTATVVREAYPDPRDDRWVIVDVQLDEVFPRFVPLAELRETEGLAGMVLLRRGNRLSVMSVLPEEWRIVLRLGEKAATGEPRKRRT